MSELKVKIETTANKAMKFEAEGNDTAVQALTKVVYATAGEGFDGVAGFMVDDIHDGLQNYNCFWHLVETVGNIHDKPELWGGTGGDECRGV